MLTTLTLKEYKQTDQGYELFYQDTLTVNSAVYEVYKQRATNGIYTVYNRSDGIRKKLEFLVEEGQ